MINLKKTLIALVTIATFFACESDDVSLPSPSVQTTNPHGNDPVDEEFDEYRRDWIEDQKRNAFKKKEDVDENSLK